MRVVHDAAPRLEEETREGFGGRCCINYMFNAKVLNNSLNENAGTSKSRYAAVAKCVTRMRIVHKTHNKLSRESCNQAAGENFIKRNFIDTARDYLKSGTLQYPYSNCNAAFGDAVAASNMPSVEQSARRKHEILGPSLLLCSKQRPRPSQRVFLRASPQESQLLNTAPHCALMLRSRIGRAAFV